MGTHSNHGEPPERSLGAFGEFALACRVERDRRAAAGIAEADRRFETSIAERSVAEAFVARLIATLAKR